jgi:hypothetical protein
VSGQQVMWSIPFFPGLFLQKLDGLSSCQNDQLNAARASDLFVTAWSAFE